MGRVGHPYIGRFLSIWAPRRVIYLYIFINIMPYNSNYPTLENPNTIPKLLVLFNGIALEPWVTQYNESCRWKLVSFFIKFLLTGVVRSPPPGLGLILAPPESKQVSPPSTEEHIMPLLAIWLSCWCNWWTWSSLYLCSHFLWSALHTHSKISYRMCIVYNMPFPSKHR